MSRAALILHECIQIPLERLVLEVHQGRVNLIRHPIILFLSNVPWVVNVDTAALRDKHLSSHILFSLVLA